MKKLAACFFVWAAMIAVAALGQMTAPSGSIPTAATGPPVPSPAESGMFPPPHPDPRMLPRGATPFPTGHMMTWKEYREKWPHGNETLPAEPPPPEVEPTPTTVPSPEPMERPRGARKPP